MFCDAYLKLLLLGLMTGCHGATFYHCNWINSHSVDCSTFQSDVACGTNLVTYQNKCEFSKAHCTDDTINLNHYGACTDADKPTTSPVAGNEVVLDFMCTSLMHLDCPLDESKVCGTDGRTYLNYCEYEKAKCTHRNLKVKNLGECV